MKRRIILTLAVLLSVFCFDRGSSQPRIEIVGGTSLDLDTLYSGDVVERNVTVRNTGDQTLHIRDVKASCGCTGTVLSSDSIAPGGSGTILISFNSKNFVGRVSKKVTVVSNADNDRALVIEFTATVKQELVLQPVQFWFKDADVGRANTAKIILRNEGAEELTVKGYTTRLKGFTLTFPTEPVQPGDEITLVAEFVPEKAASVVAEAMFLQTSNPRQPELYIPIFGNAKEFRFDETGP
ncbi:MAG: DUF1573 domain-containing protein [Bacteroidetes bacterium]|nr:DUF1573 domain-containing protein [Bacteroidota bacterium]